MFVLKNITDLRRRKCNLTNAFIFIDCYYYFDCFHMLLRDIQGTIEQTPSFLGENANKITLCILCVKIHFIIYSFAQIFVLFSGG